MKVQEIKARKTYSNLMFVTLTLDGHMTKEQFEDLVKAMRSHTPVVVTERFSESDRYRYEIEVKPDESKDV